MSPDAPYTDQITSALPQWVPQIFSMFQGVPFHIWGAIMYEESGFNPRAKNLKLPDESYGLLMLNRNGGQGRGHSPEALLDPINNVLIGMPPIRAAYAKYGDDVASVARFSGHPSENGSVPPGDPRIQRIVRTSGFIKAAGSPMEALGKLLAGVQLPDVGSYVPSPGNIGAGIVTGIGDAWNSFVENWRSSTRDLLIDKYGPMTLGIAGVGSLIVGVILMAAQSPPGQAIGDALVVAGPPQAKAAGVAIKAAGGPTAAVRAGSRASRAP